MSTNELKICNFCVMDGTAPEIVLDSKGRCNFCKDAEKAFQNAHNGVCIMGLLTKIKKEGKGKKYDILIGLSGGIDSTEALDICIKEGLRPLCFSIDNGWNDAIADENIMKIVEGLNAEQVTTAMDNARMGHVVPFPPIQIPFFRYTIDREKFEKLQGAFMQAGVINAEIPSDHIISAAAYELAAEYGIKYIISGGNVATESIMPYSWSYPARDLRHIKAIYKRFAGKRLTGLPTMSILKFNYYKWIKKIQVVNILDWYDYNREQSIKDFEKRFGYKNYGEKHEESVFTKWFQNFYLFQKFGIDKRKAHFSSLIVSGQMTRDEAMFKLTANPVYPELGIEERILKYPKHEHSEYPSSEKTFAFISKIVKALR